MDTRDFRTKTMMIERKNLSHDNLWGVALDVGYSGVKLVSPNIIACFPAFAVPVEGAFIDMGTKAAEQIMLYRSAPNAQVWKVGKSAQDSVSIQDPDAASMSIFGRQRYNSDIFKVITETAMGLACTKNAYGDPQGKPIVLETGLPVLYLKSDSSMLREVLEGFHAFDLKIGRDDWKHYEINLVPGNISIMPQPMGTLLSVATGADGKLRAEAEKYYSSATLICDPGFGTFDSFSLRGTEMSQMETFDNLGMKEVLLETSQQIYSKYGIEIPVPAMQPFLEKGYVSTFNRRKLESMNVPFADILERCNYDVAQRALAKLTDMYSLDEYSYLILTGGTGEAWYPYFKERLKGMANLTLVPGNQNTMGILRDQDNRPAPLPFIFSNVRGYYMALYNR